MSKFSARSSRESEPPQLPSAHKVGRIETQGVEYIPEEQRVSTPLNLFWILIGGNLTFAVIVVGILPVIAGLGWWAALSSLAVGSAIGALFLAPMALLAPRTGTNNPVSSGAFFGVVGRIGGSAVGLLSALAGLPQLVGRFGLARKRFRRSRAWGVSGARFRVGTRLVACRSTARRVRG